MARTGPFVVSVLEVQRSLGSRRAVSLHGSLSGLAITDASVPADADIEAALVLESTASHEVTVTGTLRAPFTAVCRRCLGPMESVLEVDVREVFEERPVEGDTYLLTRDWLDVEPMVRDALVLSLPVAPLCGDACPGPAPEVFPLGRDDDPARIPADGDDERAAEGPDDGTHAGAAPALAPRDPRWAALDGLALD